jgi:gliding motility-associated-like protein
MTGSGVYCDMSAGGAQVGLNGSEFGVDYFLLEENAGQADVEEGRYDGGPITFDVLVPNGTYTVFARNQTTGCTSSMKDTVRVTYQDTPLQPNFVTNPVVSCGQEYTGIEIDNAVSGVDYELVEISNVDSVIITRTANSDGNFVISPVASGSYYVKASWGGSCAVISEQIDIETGEIVLPAQVEDYSMNYCHGEPISITAFIDSEEWTYELADENQSVLSHINGSVGVDNTISWTFDSTEISQRYYVRVSDGTGFCGEEYSSEISISVAQAVNPPDISSDTVLYCSEDPNRGTVFIENSSSDYAYYLYRSEDTSTYLRRLFGEDGNNIAFEGLDSSEYVINAIDLSSGCESEFDTVMVFPYSSPEYIDSYISDILRGINANDTLYLGDNGLSIDVANMQSDLNYYLINEEEDTVEFDSSIGGTIDINNPGEYQLFVQYSDVPCEPVPYNGVLYVFEDMLDAHPAFIYLNDNEVSDTVTVNVTKTHIDIDNLNFFFSETGTNFYEADFGLIQFKDPTTGFVEYTKAPSFFGVDTIIYRVENLLEPSRWDQDTIFVYVGNKNMTEDRSIFIPNAFSPNGDDINEYFVISSNQSKTEESTLEVFNRWGTLVYRSQGKVYKNDWDGKANISNMVTIGDELPNGVYFYVYTIKANVDGETVIKKFNGFVELRR